MEEEKDNETAEENAASPSMMRSISDNAARLGLFALLCTLFIAGTQIITKEDIREQQRKAQLKALLQIVPQDQHDNDMLSDYLLVNSQTGSDQASSLSNGFKSRAELADKLSLREEEKIFLAKKDGQARFLIYPAIARDGYSGDIKYIVGVSIDTNIVAGVRVLAHKETPGLGDGIDLRKSDWILDFSGKSLGQPAENQWTVKKEGGVFDGFTGATITPRALTKSIANTLRLHQQYKKELLSQFSQRHQTGDK